MLRRCAACPYIVKLIAFYDKCGPGSEQHLVMEARCAAHALCGRVAHDN